MELIQNILVTALLGIWACLSIGFFVWLVQGIELDEKFCDVIVRRYIEQVGTDEKVSVLRDSKEYKYSEVAPHDE